MRYCLVDMSTLVFRAQHAIKSNDIEEVTDFAFHVSLFSMLKVYQHFSVDKIVVCFDSGSWRKDLYPEYKAHRGENDTEKDKQIKQNIAEMLFKFYDFFNDQTNVISLRQYKIEADDLISRWISLNPDDEHIIISCDHDYKQLISPKVELFDGVRNILYSDTGVYFQDGKKPKKTDTVVNMYKDQWKVRFLDDGEPEKVEPDWELFQKVMLGDKSDNISRALPPRFLRKKLKEIFYDKEDQTELAKLLDTERTDLDPIVTVADLYIRNQQLIDMRHIPQKIIDQIDEVINRATTKPSVLHVGRNLLTFCRTYKLSSVATHAQQFAGMMA